MVSEVQMDDPNIAAQLFNEGSELLRHHHNQTGAGPPGPTGPRSAHRPSPRGHTGGNTRYGNNRPSPSGNRRRRGDRGGRINSHSPRERCK